MAQIKAFIKSDKEPKSQPTIVECHWAVSHFDNGKTLLQLDTYGSGDRENPGKQSQTIQLTPDSARELFIILKAEFGL